MRAVQLDGYGGIDELEVRDRPNPEASPGRVVVDVVATSINPGEGKIRQGFFDPDRSATFPMGEGSDLAGTVRAVGDGVDGWAVGDAVIGWSGERAAHAEQVSVPADQLTRKPDDVPWDQAGSLYVAGGTAAAMRDAVSAGPGDTVVVTAAAGGVGSILVQLLVDAGVRVLGIAGPANDEWLRSVGVEPVNHGDGLADRLRTAAPDGIAAFLDAHGDGYTDVAVDLGVPVDRIVTIADFAAAQGNGAQVLFGHASTTADTLAELAGRVADGSLTVPIAATYPLEQVREAFTELERGHTRGKIVLLP
jgi:NADPH:quinone reductase-like Zn-dependent oxidoreductase